MTQLILLDAMAQGFQRDPLWTLFVLYVFFGVGFLGTGTVVWMADQGRKWKDWRVMRSKTARIVAFLFPILFWIIYGLYRFATDILFDETTK